MSCVMQFEWAVLLWREPVALGASSGSVGWEIALGASSGSSIALGVAVWERNQLERRAMPLNRHDDYSSTRDAQLLNIFITHLSCYNVFVKMYD